MDTLEAIEKLAQKARRQKIPAFHVSEQVIARLQAEDNPLSFVAFDFLAGIFATAASVLFYIGINAWTYVMNPLTQLFAPLQEVRLW